MRSGALTQILLGTGIALGIAAGGCYGDYAGTTTGNGNGTTGSGTDSGTGTGTGSGTGGGTGGGSGAANAPAGGTPSPNQDFTTVVNCTSNKYWTQGPTQGSPRMQPGDACITCHTSQGVEATFDIAGTVYPTAHEVNNCDGKAGLTVVITDAAGTVFKLPTNSAGNFGCGNAEGFPSCAGLKLPYSAYVVDSNNVYRAMASKQTSGDCNSCHTAAGMGAMSSAPGRIMAP